MATGIPRSRSPGSENSAPTHEQIRLQYAEKVANREVLSATPPPISLLWQGKQSGSMSNRLYFGDNLPVLQALLHEASVRGRVSLIYIDPPFSTKSVFESRSQKAAYEDMLQGASFIEFLRKRLIILHELL